MRSMRHTLAAIVASLMVGTAIVPTTSGAAFAAGPESVADLADRLMPSVVNISTTTKPEGVSKEGPQAVPKPKAPDGSPFQDYFDEFFNDKDGEDESPQGAQSLGSGFVIDAEKGLIVTNNHVIADATEIEVNFSDGKKIKATLVGTDPKTDIAVLKVNPAEHPLKAVKFGDSGRMRVGDWVMAIGNPFGLGGSVSVGIVSARNRDIDSGPYDDFLQTDAAINRGNSGGPLFNMDGDVIGINTAIISPSGGSIGIGFSIPSKMAEVVVSQLGQFGEMRRGWLGVRIQPVTDEVAESLGMKEARGALVAGLQDGGPVKDGAIQAGDVILKFDGQDIKEMRDLPRLVADTAVGKAVPIVLLRKGAEQTVNVTLGRLPDDEKKDAEKAKTTEGEKAAPSSTALGLTMSSLDDAARTKFGINKDVSGVVVTDVAKGSYAEQRGVVAGDVITEVQQESVTEPKDVTAKVTKLKDQGRKIALMMLTSKTGEIRFVTLRLE